MSVHFRARGNLAKYSAASRKSLSVNMLLSSSTLPTALQVWQSGKELGHGDARDGCPLVRYADSAIIEPKHFFPGDFDNPR
jgi:hypothetical protein